jgi:hypothetical protein
MSTCSGRECEIDKVLQAIGDRYSCGFQVSEVWILDLAGACVCPETIVLFAACASKLGLAYNLGHTTDNFNHEHARFLVDWFIHKNEKNLPFCFHYITYKEGTDILGESQQYRLCLDLIGPGI